MTTLTEKPLVLEEAVHQPDVWEPFLTELFENPGIIKIGEAVNWSNLQLDTSERKLYLSGQHVKLNRTQYELVRVFMQAKGDKILPQGITDLLGGSNIHQKIAKNTRAINDKLGHGFRPVYKDGAFSLGQADEFMHWPISTFSERIIGEKIRYKELEVDTAMRAISVDANLITVENQVYQLAEVIMQQLGFWIGNSRLKDLAGIGTDKALRSRISQLNSAIGKKLVVTEMDRMAYHLGTRDEYEVEPVNISIPEKDIRCGPYSFDISRRVMKIEGQEIPLTEMQTELSYQLMQMQGYPVSIDELGLFVCGDEERGDEMRTLIYQVNKRLGRPISQQRKDGYYSFGKIEDYY